MFNFFNFLAFMFCARKIYFYNTIQNWLIYNLLSTVLQVFPQVLRYNRLTGAFEEVILDDSSRPTSKYDGNSSLPYGVTDEERDAMLQWARKERLPLFLRYQYSFFPKR
jgi:hypothetical protein